MKENKDRYGINMIAYCRSHEEYIEGELANGRDPEALLKWHTQKLAWLQHERLVHLIVLVTTIVALLFSLYLLVSLTYPLLTGPLVLILLVLTGAYLIHYFKLENTVQHWYTIGEELHDMIDAGELRD